MPNTVTSIGNYAFYGCLDLANINMSQKLKFIGIRAFAGCKALQVIGFPKSIIEIYSTAFKGCVSLRKAIFPKDKEDLAKKFEEYYEKCTIELI